MTHILKTARAKSLSLVYVTVLTQQNMSRIFLDLQLFYSVIQLKSEHI